MPIKKFYPKIIIQECHLVIKDCNSTGIFSYIHATNLQRFVFVLHTKQNCDL